MTDEYYEGEWAYYEGISLWECPYDYHTDEYVDWRHGWFDAREEDFI